MIVNQQHIADAGVVYETYWDSYLNGDVDTFASTLDDHFEMIGTSEKEICHGKAGGIDYCKNQIMEVAGKLEKRNRQMKSITIDGMVLINEFCDIFILIDTDWNFYSQARISTLLKQTPAGWKVVQQHGSLPDNRVDANENETIAIEKISKENLELRSAIKRRTIELEQRNRELEIEAALERVRARTMAMRKSEELNDVAYVLYQELIRLGGDLWGCGFGFCKEDSDVDEFRFAYEKGILPPVLIPHTEDPAHKAMYRAWVEKEDFFSISETGEKLKAHYNYMLSLDDVKPFFQEIIDAGLSFPEWQQWNAAYFSQGYIMVISTNPYQDKQMLKRFANVFEQTYTRFLDLKKAEEQAREAEIQLALERVRSRSLAMHHSDELPDVLSVLFEQFDILRIKPAFTHLSLFDEENDTFTFRMTGFEGQKVLVEQVIDINKMEVWQDAYRQWREEEDNAVSCIDYPPEVLPDIFKIMEPIFSELPEDSEMRIEDFPNGLYTTQANCKFGYLGFNHTRRATEEEKDIVTRFAREFGITYNRFLDLQKAEAQARESEIQLALERVRAKSMAMQHSDDLTDVLTVVFEQLTNLGVQSEWTHLTLINLEANTFTYRMTTREGKRVFADQVIDLDASDLWKDSAETFKSENPETITQFEIPAESLPDIWDIFDGIFSSLKEDDKISPEDFPNGIFTTEANCKFGYLGINRKSPASDEEGQILARFAKEFGMVYQRFLDIQRAEEQAREAQVEAALEKVRSRSLAMQNPDELIEVVQLLREEMGALGVEELETSSIYIHHEDTGSTECWFTIKDTDHPVNTVTDRMIIDLNDTWVGRRMHDFYNSPAQRISIVMQGDNRLEWIRYCEEKSDLFGNSEFYGDKIPERTYHLYKFSNGFLGAASPGPISDESWDLLKRATSAFSFAYTRFSDLQIAEASVRASKRQASLDRIRAEVASMRSKEDLQQITPLIWKEMKTLDIPFIRCGVFIMEEDKGLSHTYLSTSEGESIAALHLPVEDISLIRNIRNSWNKHEIYTVHWEQNDFIEWTQSLIDQGFINSKKKYEAGSVPETLDLHFLPFKRGMLYIGNTAPLSKDNLILGQSIADAFSVAYERYEDFNKLEQAKQKIEEAFQELETAKDQLVQQEKLASLGQLTAGIAHEIKNPLNFINNFSDLSIELIAEVKKEIKDTYGEQEQAITYILEDIQTNLKTIHKHGSRADTIVKSMLEHSRGSSNQMEPHNVNKLLKEFGNLSFHGMRAGKKPINVDMHYELDKNMKEIPLVAEDFSRVIVNLCNNGFDAMREKTIDMRREGKEYTPKLTLRSRYFENNIVIEIEDNGPGISEDIKDKIMQPFFTTKKGTEGTGLGLSISGDIIKAHGGNLKIESKKQTFTKFIINIPT